VREQVGDQAKALFRRVRRRRQPEIDQRERRRRVELAQQLDGVRPRVAGIDGVFGAERDGLRVRDLGVVVDHQLAGFFFRRRLWFRHHERIS
jgi:hypothetical protein